MNRNRFLTGRLMFPEQGEPAASGDPPPDPAAAIAAMQQRMDALEASNAELEETARFWEERAGGTGGKADSAPAAAPRDPSADITAINTKGFDAIKEQFPAWAKEAGFLTKAEADALVREANIVNGIAREHPDLANAKSEFRAAFVRHMTDLEGMPQTKRMAKAAELARLELQVEGKYRAPESDEDRVQRILAQSGIPTMRPSVSSKGFDAKDKEMAAAFGVDEDTFKKYAEGVDFEFSTTVPGGK